MRRTLQTRPAKPFASPTCILAGTGDTIDRDLTDDEIKKVEERIGDYLPDWFDLLEMAINDVVNE